VVTRTIVIIIITTTTTNNEGCQKREKMTLFIDEGWWVLTQENFQQYDNSIPKW
jgi:hypothetical protein